MIYYDENDNIIDESEVDLAHGYLTDRTYEHHDDVAEVYHYVESAPLPSGTKLKKKVIDTPYQPAWDEVTSQIYHYTGLTDNEIMRNDLDDVMAEVEDLKPGEIAYATKENLPANTWVTMLIKYVPKGSYSVVTNADEYRLTKGSEELANGFMDEAGFIAVDVKSVTSGSINAALIKM